MQRRGLHGCNLRFHPTGASPGRGERPPPGAVIHVRRGSLPGPGRGTGWLDGDRDDGSSGSNVQHRYSNCCTYENGRNGENSGNGGQDPGRDRSHYTHVQQNERRESIPGKTTGEGVPAAVGVPVFPALLHMNRRNPRTRAEIPISARAGHNSVAATAVHLLHIAAHLLHCCQSTPATMRRTSPRLRPTLRVLQGGGAYLCYDCLKKAKRPAMVQSLPGVLDHRTFERTKVELGRCDVCGMGKAVYRSRSTKSSPVAGFPMGNVLHPIRTLYNDSVMFQRFAAMGDQPIQCWKQANR